MSKKTVNAKVLVAQLGARKHYQEPILFHQWGILDRLCTDFYSGHSSLVKLLREDKIYQKFPNIVKKSLDRYDPALETAKIVHFPKLATYAQRLKQASPDQRSRIVIDTGKEFCQRIINLGLGDAQIVYGFDGACLELFKYAKSLGIRCILDQTIAERSLIYQLLLEEQNLWPGWLKSPFQVYEADRELVERQQQEQDLADRIICGSTFVKDSLVARGIPADKITVVPLGRCQDNQLFLDRVDRQTPEARGDGLRILFAGSVGLRKGIQYLLAALQQLQGEIPYTCKIAGSLDITDQKVAEFSDIGELLGLIPRSQMRELYAWADVLVLPSICEGSAMVTYEALSWELPIITTYNSGSIVRDGIDGFLVPIRNTEAIATKLKFLYSNHLSTSGNQKYQDYWRQIQINAQQKLEYCLLEV